MKNPGFKNMKQNPETIYISGLGVRIIRKPIRNLYLMVNRDTGEPIISAPRRINTEKIRVFVDSKRGWIEKQQERIRNRGKKIDLQYIGGEEHLLGGIKYILKVTEQEGPPGVVSEEPFIHLRIRTGYGFEKREKIMNNWYREVLNRKMHTLIEMWEQKMNVKVREQRIKKMKSKWGACNVRDSRIWINMELAKLSDQCLEYIVVHEMIHLIERGHNRQFYSLLDKFLPGWKSLRRELGEYSMV